MQLVWTLDHAGRYTPAKYTQWAKPINRPKVQMVHQLPPDHCELPLRQLAQLYPPPATGEAK